MTFFVPGLMKGQRPPTWGGASGGKAAGEDGVGEVFRKPREPVEIDWTHPLAKGLELYVLFDSYNRGRDLVHGHHPSVPTSPAANHPNIGTTGWEFDGGTNDQRITYPVRGGPNCTWATEFTFYGLAGTQYQYYVSIGAQNTANSMNMYVGENSNATVSERDLHKFYGYGDSVDVSNWTAYKRDHTRIVVGVMNGTDLHAYYPIYGRPQETNNQIGPGAAWIRSSSITQTAAMQDGTYELSLGGRSDGNIDRYANGIMPYFIMWRRALTEVDVTLLAKNGPYCMLKPAGAHS